MAGVTALWHLKRKPPIPTVNPIGSLTLFFLLKRIAGFHAFTPDEALVSLWTPQRNHEIHIGPGEEP